MNIPAYERMIAYAKFEAERHLVEEASRTIAVLHTQLAQVTAERDKLRAELESARATLIQSAIVHGDL